MFNWHEGMNCGYVQVERKMRGQAYTRWIYTTLTYLLTYSMELSPSWEAGLVKKFPAFYTTKRFITAFTSARHLSLSCASSIQSTTPYPTSWRSILILSSHLRLGLPSGLFPSDFPTKTLYTPLLSPIRATCPAHLILIDLITRTMVGEDYRSLSSSLCSFLHSHVISGSLSLRHGASPGCGCRNGLQYGG